MSDREEINGKIEALEEELLRLRRCRGVLLIKWDEAEGRAEKQHCAIQVRRVTCQIYDLILDRAELVCTRAGVPLREEDCTEAEPSLVTK